MDLKKNKVPKINREKKRRHRSSSRKEKRGILRGILKGIRDETREVRAEMSSLKESQDKILTELDDLNSEIAHTREVNKHVIQHNTRTHQLFDLMLARILTGFVSPDF